MANTKQARKRARQTVARNLHLASQRSQYRTAIKTAESVIDTMARKRVLHGNAAARHKSRLAASIKAMA